MERHRLRPYERAVLRLADQGMDTPEIAWRFRRSPGHIARVLGFSRLPRTAPTGPAREASPLRPLERTVIRARGNGAELPEIAARMRRSPNFVARVEELASLKLDAGPGRAS
jgi:hypothetical protein